MNKVAIVSDIHFGVNKNSEIFLKSSLDFFTKQFVPYLNDNNIDTVLILGDVFDNRNNINVKIHDEVYNLFSNTLKDFKIIILIGNHDIYYKTSNDVHSLKFLNHLDNVDVIDEITNKNICGVDVLLCPWLVDYNCDKIAEKFEETKSEILFGHFDIVGFALNATRVSSEGFDPEVFSKFKKVFSGHYHTPSSKLIGKTEIIYVGSPYHMNRNDVGEHKGFLVLDMETYLYNRVVNNVSLKFVQAEYPYLPEPSDVCGNIVDALVTIRQQDLIGNSVDKYIEKIEKMNPAEKVNIVMNVIPEQHSDFENIKCDINSIPDIIELYINNDVEIDNKFEILTEIMNIYDEVK